MTTKSSRKEAAQLRALAAEAWEAELRLALQALFEDFSRWSGHELDSFELSDRIHKFHDGISRELYKRYTALPAQAAVEYAIARGVIDADGLDPALLEKLGPAIAAFRANAANRSPAGPSGAPADRTAC